MWRTFRSPKSEMIKMFTIVQATPGYELLTASTASDPDFGFWRSPIIAWRIGLDGRPAPVTVGDHERCANPHAILMPDGQVEIQCETTFASIEDWEKYAREEHTEERAKCEASIAGNECTAKEMPRTRATGS
jgi:hypothetical protein